MLTVGHTQTRSRDLVGSGLEEPKIALVDRVPGIPTLVGHVT